MFRSFYLATGLELEPIKFIALGLKSEGPIFSVLAWKILWQVE